MSKVIEGVVDVNWKQLALSYKDRITELESQLTEARRSIRNALNFTSPSRDKAAWRVSAIEQLPKEEHEHFYDLLSRSRVL